MSFKIEKRMSIYDVGENPIKFVRAVKISGELAADPGHVVFTTALEQYHHENSSKFTSLTFNIHNYCIAIVDGTMLVDGNVHPLINGIVNDVQICDNGNVRYRGYEIIRSGKIGSTSEYVYSTYNSDGALMNHSDSLDTALDRIDTNIIVK